MANPMKGQASFEAAGKRWTLTMSFNELVELEDEWDLTLDKDFGERISEKLRERSRNVRTLFRIMLSAEHDEMTDRDVGDLMSEVGLDECAELIRKTVSNAFPQGGDANPPKPPRPAAKRKPGR